MDFTFAEEEKRPENVPLLIEKVKAYWTGCAGA